MWSKRTKLIVVAGVMASSAAVAAPPQSVEVACRDVPEAENHLAVLMSSDDVLRVEVLKGRRTDVEAPIGDGARIVLAARSFVTSDWLRRAIDCHLARNAARGKVASATNSPLDVPGAIVHVSAAPGTLTVDVTSDNRKAARVIQVRALALRPGL